MGDLCTFAPECPLVSVLDRLVCERLLVAIFGQIGLVVPPGGQSGQSGPGVPPGGQFWQNGRQGPLVANFGRMVGEGPGGQFGMNSLWMPPGDQCEKTVQTGPPGA